MKRVILFVLLSILLTACAAPVEGSNAVQIPEALILLINGLILMAVTLGLQVVFEVFGLDLRGLGAALAVAVAGFAVAQLQGFIDIIPAAYDQLVTIVLNVLVVILSGLGTLRAVFHRSRAAQMFAPK